MSVQDDVLTVLLERQGASVSGAELASRLGVTRSAVWKAVEKLRADGYPIDAVTNRGYTLTSDCGLLSKARIEQHLQTEILGRNLCLHRTLESTNKTAKELAADGAPDGTVVIAEQQIGGRGRLGRTFYSPPGSGIYMSVILRPKLDTDHTLLLTSAAAVAVARAIGSEFGIFAGIKWVNDIYISDKKVCGILTEGGLNFETGGFDYVVIGIGVNVTTAYFPEEIRDIASAITPDQADRARLIASILSELETIYKELPNADFMLDYRARSIVIGHDVWVIRGDDRYKANVLDVNSFGNLLVRDENGEIREISTGEVSIRKAE